MKKIRVSTLTVLVAIGVGSMASLALAQPRHDDRRDDRRDDHRDDRRDDRRDLPAVPPPGAAVAPPVGAAVAPPAPGAVAEAPPAGMVPAAPDPALRARLRAFEDQRRQNRKLAVKDPKTWNDGRPQRANEHRSQIATTWGGVVNTPEAQAELKTHADRMARLNRILDLANQKGDTALAARCTADIQSEDNRDAEAMQAIRTRYGAR